METDATPEDRADVEAYDRAKRDGGESIPAAFANRLIDGESPVRVYRELRGLTQSALAERSGVRLGIIDQLESEQRPGSVDTLKKLTEALQVTIDDLV